MCRTRPGSRAALTQQGQCGDDGQDDDNRLEDPLIHVLGEASTGQGRGDDDRSGDRRQRQGRGIDQAGRDGEGQLDQVDQEEEPGRRPVS